MRVEGFDRGKTRSGKPSARRTLAFVSLLVVAAISLLARWALYALGSEYRALHGDGETAIGAIDPALRRMPAKDRLPFLLKSVHDPSPGLRYAAVDALSRYPTPESAAAIESAYQDSASIVRERALETLHVVDQERGMRLLMAALRDEDLWMRQTAVLQLAQRNSPKRSAADQSSPTTAGRSEPASSDGRIVPLADRRAVPALIHALDDEDDVVTRYSVAILRRLTGRGSVYHTADGQAGKQQVIEDWKRWWRADPTRYSVPREYADARQIRPMRSDPAPSFDLRDIEGGRVRLSALRGHPILLNFWGTWCAPCRLETRNLEKIYQAYKGSGLVVIGAAVAEQNGENGLRTWSTQHGLTYLQLLSTPELQQAYGNIEEVPVTVLIDKQGRIRYRWEAERDFSTFQAAVTRMLTE